MGDLLTCLFWLTILFIAYFTGSRIEKKHYQSIKEREILYLKKPYLSMGKFVMNPEKVKSAELVSANVVIGCDFFKTFLAGLVNMFGGNISAYESVLDRGRREAILRMRKMAYESGANIIINVKLETIMLDPIGVKASPKISVVAYGTAIKYDI